MAHTAKLFDRYKKELPLNYVTALDELIIVLRSKKSFEERLEYFKSFTKKYTTFPFLWSVASIYLNFHYPKKTTNQKIQGEAVSHLINEIWGETMGNNRLLSKIIRKSRFQPFFTPPKLPKMLFAAEKCSKLLFFPHSLLTNYFEFYCKNTASPISAEIQEQYNKSLNLYKKIMSSTEDNNQWLKYVKEVKDLNFIIQNIECRIGCIPCNKEMWKLYIDFLKENNLTELMFHTYSRYCRFFVDDYEIRQEYKNLINKNLNNDGLTLKNIVRWQKDIIKIENDFGSAESAIEIYQKYFEPITKNNFEIFLNEMNLDEYVSPLLKYITDDKPIEVSISFKSSKIPYNSNNAILQNFSLPSTYIYDICKRAKYDNLQKLYSTSKYFFAVTKSPLCLKIRIGDYPKTVSFQHAFFISCQDENPLENCKKIYVKDEIDIEKMPLTILCQIIGKIYKCDATKLNLKKQDIKLTDFLFLSSNVESLTFDETYVFDENDKSISLPKLFEEMPKVKMAKFEKLYRFPPFPATSTTKIKSIKTLEDFYCRFIESPNDSKTICEFIKNNLTTNGKFYLRCLHEKGDVENFVSSIQEMIDCWEPDDGKKPILKLILNNTTYDFS